MDLYVVPTVGFTLLYALVCTENLAHVAEVRESPKLKQATLLIPAGRR